MEFGHLLNKMWEKEMISINDCRKVEIEEAIEILAKNPGGYMEHIIAGGKWIRKPALFIYNSTFQYMEVIESENMSACDLVNLLTKSYVYTQTDEYLKGE